MIAGLEHITKGELYIDDQLMNNIEPKNRNISMVFQSYALYPYMSVYDNIAFGLKYKKVSQDEIKERVHNIAQMLDIKDILNRKAGLLSGGQQQRVSIGRAIIRDTDVFLMDEPLSNLDAKLRFQMRAEIKKIHQKMKKTTIYVTHDQIEAMSMADRVVVMNQGKIQQIGTPIQIYKYPENMFVASFLGIPSINFIKGSIKNGNFIHNQKKLELNSKYKADLINYEGKEIVLGIRPEDFCIENGNNDHDAKSFVMELSIDYKEYLGNEVIITGHWGEELLKIKVDSNINLESNKMVHLQINKKNILFFDSVTKKRIKLEND